MKKRVLSVIALLLSLTMFVVGCSSGSKSEESEKRQKVQMTRVGQLLLLTKLHHQILTVINPQTGQLLL